MVYPSFWDLTKDIDELFTSGYFESLLKLDVKTKTMSGVKFRFGGEESLKGKGILAFIEAQYDFKEYGVTFKENWSTDNVLTTALTIDEYFAGWQHTLETVLYPDKYPRDDPSTSNQSVSGREWSFGDKKLRLESMYRNNYGTVTFETIFGACKIPRVEFGPVFRGGAVLNVLGLILGCGIGIDLGAPAMLDCVLGAHYESEVVVLNAFLENARVLSTSIFQKFFDGAILTGVTARCSLFDTTDRDFQFACRCNLDEDTAFYFKYDNVQNLGIGLSQRIRKGVKFLLSFVANASHLFDTTVSGKDYQFGACLELGDDD